jgi:hypothetical protein
LERSIIVERSASLRRTRTLALAGFLLVLAGTDLARTQQQTPVPQAATTAKQIPFGKELKTTVGLLTATFINEGERHTESGTCFFVSYPDDRLPKDTAFNYIVTNRHVAQPGIEDGHPYRVLAMTLRLNRKDSTGGSSEITLPSDGPSRWYFPTDDAVDLAVMPFAPDRSIYEYEQFPVSMFATKDEVERANIVEGNSVVFTGFFYQVPGLKKFQPIVREGIIAMMPDEKLETTLHKQGDLYLADVHAFEGNSGSPLIINEGGFRNGQINIYNTYKLLGVISGFYHEDSNLTLSIATTYKGTVEGNSGIASVVPADALKDVLDDPEAKAGRDIIIAITMPR